MADPPQATDIGSFCANVGDSYDPFDDVSDSDTFAVAIRCQAYANLTEGLAPRRYGPAEPVSRAQMATFLVNLVATANELQLGSGDVDSQLNELVDYDGTNNFTDVADDSTHVANINRLAQTGVVLGGPGGLPSTSYGPDQTVSRQHMASFIVRTLEFLRGVVRVSDNDYFSDDDDSVHEPAINAVAEVGIAVGDGADLFDPSARLSRGQMSAFLVRSLANFEGEDVIAPLPARTSPSDPFSTSASVDNANGSATISFTVRDTENNGIEDLESDEFTLLVPGQDEPSNLATLIAAFPEVWGPFTNADAGDGVYTVILTAEPGSYTYTDITVRGVEIDPSLQVTITAN